MALRPSRPRAIFLSEGNCTCARTWKRVEWASTFRSQRHPPMVNWDVVSGNWRDIKTQLRDVVGDVERGWKRLTS